MSDFFPAMEPAMLERVAVHLPDGTLTWAQLAQACAGHGERLQKEGIRPGDRVAVWAHPTLGTVVAMVANLARGVVTVPLNPKLGERERKHILQDARPKLVLEHPEVTLGPASPLARTIDDRDALIIYTSGTTGAPKGAVLTARNLVTCLDGLASAWQWTGDDVVVHALPLFHVHGLCLGLFGSLRVGGGMHALGRFDLDAVSEALVGAGTMLFAVPTMYHRMAEVIAGHPSLVRALREARLLVSGSAALAGQDARALEEHAGVVVYQRYGLTETLINCAARVGDCVPGTVGPPIDGVELRIVDEGRHPLAAGEIGEIAVRGNNVFPGYLGNEDATRTVIDDDGWFYTGDVAQVTRHGHILVHGRKSTDLIKTGGYKVGAGEVEACLLDHDDVAEVAVVGMPDSDLGERIVAAVVPRDAACDPLQLVQWVASELSPHKRPREIRIVDALPRNAMGKVQKKVLVEQLEASRSE